MFDRNESEPLNIDERLIVLTGYLIVSAMMVCLTVIVVQIGEVAQPRWDGDYLIMLSFFVSLEALHANRLLRNVKMSDRRWIGYRVSEWVIILFVLKLVQVFQLEDGTLLNTISSWQQDFTNTFFNRETLFGVITLIIIWFISDRFAADLNLLEVNRRVIQMEAESGIYENRILIRERLCNRLILVGGGMVVLTALMRADLLTRWLDLHDLRVGVSATFFYFVLGMVLLSLTQFNLLRARWLRDSLVVRKEIAIRWILYSIGFLLVLGLIARSLPTGYTIGFLSTLNYIIFAVIGLLNLLILLLVLPIFWVLSWVLSFLMGDGSELSVGSPPDLADLPSFSPGDPIIWWEVFKAIIFWVVLIIIIGYASYVFMRENKGLFSRLYKYKLFSALISFFRWVQKVFLGVNRHVTALVNTGWKRLRERRASLGSKRLWRYVNPNRLPPQSRVRFYFLALVRRAGESGYKRSVAQTPVEYTQELSRLLKVRSMDIQGEVDGLSSMHKDNETDFSNDLLIMTEKFSMARYSNHEINEEEAYLVRSAWVRIRSLLRRVRSKEEEV